VSVHLLIADDDRNLRVGLAALLKREGYDCELVADGAAAWDAFQRRRHPLVVLDIAMPKVDGLTLCKRIRAASEGTQILLLTARDLEDDRIRGMEIGADDYVTKPFSPRELVARIGAMARRNRSALDQEPFAMGDLTIDIGALRALRGDQRIDLTRREAALLKLLKEQAGQAVSRDDILDAVWGRSHNPDSRALDQYVSALRRKIERDPSAPEIVKTVHGVGYRYEDPI
jgi:DNA-binding response OmpR family regulator